MKLFIIIKREYFDQIKAGTKTEEFRLTSDYWKKKIVNRNYESIIFQAGYKRNSPRLEIEYLGYEVKKINHSHFGTLPVQCFSLKLGKEIAENAE